MKKTCTILILTYKGKYHLEFLLPTVKQVIENSPDFQIDVLIVDNGQHEPTKKYVNDNFSDYQFVYSPVNDYLFSMNPYLKEIKSEIIFLLNDDIKIHADAINKALPLFNDEKIFSVSCNVNDWDGTYSAEGTRELFYKRGWLSSRWNTDGTNDTVRYTLYSGGGAAFFRTKMINQLDGFDPLFRPAYCEDLDLGHRAWQSGFKVVRHPESILYHREGGTIKDQFKADILTQKVYKNQILWMLKNGNHPGFFLWFLILLPYRILTGWKVDKNSYIALLKSLHKLPFALIRRFQQKKAKVNDKEIMKMLNTKY